MPNRYIVFDFETTGLSPNLGDRSIEVAAVLVVDGNVSDKFQALMNPGKKISSFIESYTGITNAMLSTAPSNAVSMKKFSQFIGDIPLIAHNASFDKKFLEHELGLIGLKLNQPIACSLKVARRIYQEAPNHKLKTLIEMNRIKISGDFHRALADAEMTAQLWIRMSQDIRKKYNLGQANFELMHLMSNVPKKNITDFLIKYSKA
jgi:DNA polymerase-3 subunit epsilon